MTVYRDVLHIRWSVLLYRRFIDDATSMQETNQTPVRGHEFELPSMDPRGNDPERAGTSLASLDGPVPRMDTGGGSGAEPGPSPSLDTCARPSVATKTGLNATVRGTATKASNSKTKRPAPAWLEPVDLGALASAIDTNVPCDQSKRRRSGKEPVASTSSDCEDDRTEDDGDMHAWMRDALRSHVLDQSKDRGAGGEETREIEIAEESLDALTSCLGGILEKVLETAKGMGGGGRAKELTSLDIHKSIKSLFPDKGEGAEGRKGLRPYLPRMMKDAWKLDKESLPKGVKKRSGLSRPQ